MRWIETDTASDQNISSATAIGAYTADADRLVIVDVQLDAVAGNGDYVMYVTKQINGAGSAYVILPKTTMAAASGETAIAGQSGIIAVKSGDVLTVYVDGLAGDTTTPDYYTRWFEIDRLVTLADDAITAGKFDESTAFPVKSADTGATQIARVGADSDTLETLSDQLDLISATAGPGASANTFTVRDSSGNPLSNAHVWVTIDLAGTTTVASGLSNALGQVTFYLDAGVTYYVWKQKEGYDFINPDVEVAV